MVKETDAYNHKMCLGLSIGLIYPGCSSFSPRLPHTTRNSLRSTSLMLRGGLCEGVWGGGEDCFPQAFLIWTPLFKGTVFSGRGRVIIRGPEAFHFHNCDGNSFRGEQVGCCLESCCYWIQLQMVAVLGGENTVCNIGLVLNFGSRVMSYDFAPWPELFIYSDSVYGNYF